MARAADKAIELLKSMFAKSATTNVGPVSLLLDQAGTVVYYNLPAQRLLGDGDGLNLSPDGKLLASDPRAGNALSVSIRTCLDSTAQHEDGRAALVQVGRPSGKPPLLVCLWPCRAGEAGSDRGPGLLVVINDLEQSEHTIQHLLSNLYELTPSEVEVAMHLLQGQSAKEIAEARQVSITTVRTQIRNLLMKTDTQRQSEFIALVFRCLSLMVR